MSYTIEYERQFIKSEHGITPCWLAGDNNVTEFTFKGRERRCRSWSVFYNLLGVTERDILESIQPSLGGYGEHWRKNGKWVDDEGIIRWVKNGCKAAASIEDILDANRMRAIHCYASIWSTDLKNEKMLSRWVSTTEEFDKWLDDAKEMRELCQKDGKSFYPIVDFGTEKLAHPSAKQQHTSEKVILQVGSGHNIVYLSQVRENGSSWTPNIKEALVLDCEKANLMKHTGDGWMRKAKLVDAGAKDFPYNAVIQFVDGTRAGSYVRCRTNRTLYTTYKKAYAHIYKDRKAAEAAMKKMQTPFRHVGTMAVVILES